MNAAARPLRAALLTPPGRGAVAVVGFAGPGAATIVARHFVAARGDSQRLPLDRICFGRWLAEANAADVVVLDGSSTAAHGEELVVCRRGDDDFEIHGHGGLAASTAILDGLRCDGAEIVDWQTWHTARDDDPIAAAARAALAEARTLRTASILLDQLQGALRHAIDELRQLVAVGNSALARSAAERLLARAALGRRLVEPFRVVLTGRPNVGKSSLINALVGYDRAVVFDQPGTTRDVVTATTAFDGWPVELADTAGIRDSQDPIETAGIAAARKRLAEADLVVVLFDAGEPWMVDDAALLAAHPAAIVVHSKCDRAVADAARPPGLDVSSVTGAGLDRLMQAIVARLVPAPPQPGEAVPFTASQVAEIERLVHACRN